MRLLNTLKQLLGAFWGILCADLSIVYALCRAYIYCYRSISTEYSAHIVLSNTAGRSYRPVSYLPHKLVIPVTSIQQLQVAPGVFQYVVQLTDPQFQSTYMISDHAGYVDRLMLRGADFRIQGSSLIFLSDPSEFGVATATRVVDNVPQHCHIFWCFTSSDTMHRNVFGALFDCDPMSDNRIQAQWRVARQGCTILNISALACAIMDCACAQAPQGQFVHHIQQVGTRYYVYTNKRAYGSKYPPTCSVGQFIACAQPVFGYGRVITDHQQLPAGVQQIAVSTSVGKFYAPNYDVYVSAQPDTGNRYLPLFVETDSGLMQPATSYNNAIRQKFGSGYDIGAYCAVQQGVINPCAVCLGDIQRGRWLAVTVPEGLDESTQRQLMSRLDAVLPMGTIIYLIKQ